MTREINNKSSSRQRVRGNICSTCHSSTVSPERSFSYETDNLTNVAKSLIRYIRFASPQWNAVNKQCLVQRERGCDAVAFIIPRAHKLFM